MRTSLLTKVGVRKIFVAKFASYGSVYTDDGNFTTALLLNVKDHGTVVADHAWIKVTSEFLKVGLLEGGEKLMFRARVVMYPKGHHMQKYDVGLNEVTKVQRCNWK